MAKTKPLAFDLLYQFESILQSDPLIDEVGFIHPSQFVALIESSGTPIQSPSTAGQSGDIVESLLSEVHPSDMVFWIKDHKLGISTQALHSLYNAAKHAFMASREQYKGLNDVYAKKDGHGNNVSCCSSSSLDTIESEVMKHSRALLLLSTDFGTAWNSRKDIVSKKQQLLLYVEELSLSELILSYAPKSEPAWSHRRWVIKMIAGKWSNLQEIVEKESELVKTLAEKSKMNYRAWNHRCWLVSYMPERQVLSEVIDRDWAGLHVADNSCFHYRTRLLLRVLEDSWHKQDANACAGNNTELHILWKEELDWDEMLIRRYIGREALWLYRRLLSLCWIKHFAANALSVSDNSNHTSRIAIDLFMDDELQFVRTCTTTNTDDIFEDYESQAKFSATYLLWLMKEMQESAGVEPGEKLKHDVEEILNKVCPEKAFLCEFLRTEQ